VGDDFWYSSMRSPSTTPSPSELSDLSTLSKKIAPQKSGATRPGGEGGIRTHGDVATTPDFESGTFDHSATSPALNFAAGHCRKFYQPPLSAQFSDATHVRPQHLRHRYRTVCILIIFQHSYQRTADSQTRTVQGVHQLILALRIFKSRLQTT